MIWTSWLHYLYATFALMELVPGYTSLACSCVGVEFIAKRRHIIADVVNFVLPGTTDDLFSDAGSPHKVVK